MKHNSDLFYEVFKFFLGVGVIYKKQLFPSRRLSAMMVVLLHFYGKRFMLALQLKSMTIVNNNKEIAKQQTQ